MVWFRGHLVMLSGELCDADSARIHKHMRPRGGRREVTWLVQAVLADEEQLGNQLRVRLSPAQ